MNAIEIEDVKTLAESWHQILEIKRAEEKFIVTVSRGLVEDRDGSRILAEAVHVPVKPEIEEFLQSVEIQAKIFAPCQRGIVLVDIAGYSRFNTRGQSAMLAAFHEGLQAGRFSSDLFSGGEKNIDLIVPRGDGCFVILREGIEEQVLQSIFSIHAGFYCYQKRMQRDFRTDGEVVGLRFACHVGELSFITDVAGNRNAFGTGMNETARILDLGRTATKEAAAGEDPTGIVYFADNLDAQASLIAEFFATLRGDNPPSLRDLGVRRDKHQFEYPIRSFGPLPNHIGFTFGTPLPKSKNPNPIFLRA